MSFMSDHDRDRECDSCSRSGDGGARRRSDTDCDCGRDDRRPALGLVPPLGCTPDTRRTEDSNEPPPMRAFVYDMSCTVVRRPRRPAVLGADRRPANTPRGGAASAPAPPPPPPFAVGGMTSDGSSLLLPEPDGARPRTSNTGPSSTNREERRELAGGGRRSDVGRPAAPPLSCRAPMRLGEEARRVSLSSRMRRIEARVCRASPTGVTVRCWSGPAAAAGGGEDTGLDAREGDVAVLESSSACGSRVNAAAGCGGFASAIVCGTTDAHCASLPTVAHTPYQAPCGRNLHLSVPSRAQY